MANHVTEDLDRQVRFYQGLCYATNTKKAYNVHRRAYIAFCNSVGAKPVPADTKLLCRYAVHLARKLKFNSIKQYLNIVRLLHLEMGLPNPCIDNFHLSATLRGIKRHLGDAVIRKEPITPDMLKSILAALDISSPRGAAVWAACCLMFFGLLRRSNVMVQNNGGFDPEKQLRRRDLVFTHEGLRVHLLWSKTIQFKERTLTIPYPWRKGHRLCPTQGVFQSVRLTRAAP